jgi:hypothetical protein
MFMIINPRTIAMHGLNFVTHGWTWYFHGFTPSYHGQALLGMIIRLDNLLSWWPRFPQRSSSFCYQAKTMDKIGGRKGTPIYIELKDCV